MGPADIATPQARDTGLHSDRVLGMAVVLVEVAVSEQALAPGMAEAEVMVEVSATGNLTLHEADGMDPRTVVPIRILWSLQMRSACSGPRPMA